MKAKWLLILTAGILLCCFALFQIGCKKDKKENPAPPTYTDGQGEVGPVGGTVIVGDQNSPIYGASIEIPEGALTSEVTIRIESAPDDVNFPGDSAIQLIAFEPAGLKFKNPVQITLPYNGNDIQKARVYYYDDDDDIVSEMPITSKSQANDQVTFQTDHFSYFTACEYLMTMKMKMVYNNADLKIGAMVYIDGWNTYALGGGTFYPGLQRIPVKMKYWLDYGSTAEYVVKNADIPLYSHFTVKLYDDDFFFPYKRKIELYVKREKAGSSFTAFVYKYNETGVIYTTDIVEYEGDEGLETWFTGKPLIFYFDDFEFNPEKKYWIKTKWYFSKNADKSNSFTSKYELNNKEDKKKPSDMELISNEDIYNTYIDADYVDGGGNQPPNPPTNPSPADNAQNVSVNTTLSWSCTDPNDDDIDYDVYFGSENPPPYIGVKTSAYYNPGTLEPNTTYYWQILPFDDVSYMDSDLLQTWSFTTETGSGSGPNPPSNIHAGNWYNIGVYWHDESNNEDGFKVYKATNQINSGYSLLGEANANEEFYADASISGNNYYCYKVVSYNNDGETSSEFAVVPKSPTDIQASPDENDILVYWSDPYESQATRFYIYRKDGSNGEWESKGWVGASNTSYQDYNVQSGIDYYYRVESTWGENSADALSRSLPSDEIGPFQISGGGGNGCEGQSTLTYGGQTYELVEIGNQCWMAENLNYETANSWWYNNSSANGDIYGRLYTWEAALTACPSGWSLPSDEEWKTLEMHLGISQSEADDTGWRGTDQGEQMKSTSGWYNNGNGTNSSGFNALPGGSRLSSGSFYRLGYYGHWWSSTEGSSTTAWGRRLYYNNDQVDRNYNNKTLGFSVRCLKN